MATETTSPAVIVCGVNTGKRKRFACPCCGIESDDIEAFATSACWPCGFGMNLDCPRCVEYGVFVNSFSAAGHWTDDYSEYVTRKKGHRFLRWDHDSSVALTACGVRIARSDIGAASSVVLECRRCWPEPKDGDE